MENGCKKKRKERGYESEIEVKGIVWKTDTTLSPPDPSIKLQEHGATLIPKHARKFDTPIESLLSFMPAVWFQKVVYESNKYALLKYDKEGKGYGKFKVCGMIFKELSIKELLQFHGILIKVMLHEAKGRMFTYYWREEGQTSSHLRLQDFMSLKRFQQIRSVISFNSSPTELKDGKQDALYKIRPILNILKRTLGAYVKAGSDVSLDEATFPSRSSYGRKLIYYNPRKPAGKFHIKAYCICCPITNVMLAIRFATRNNSDKSLPTFLRTSQHRGINDNREDDESSESVHTHTDESQDDVADPIIEQIVKDMVTNLPAGVTVNCDNMYTSITTAISLAKDRKKPIFMRGTLRARRKFVPKSILFTAKESRTLPRGYRRVAVSTQEKVAVFSWLDTKPVVMMTTADGTGETAGGGVARKQKSDRVLVPAPLCISNYNKLMGGVDRHDQIRASMSLHKSHTFMRWYVQFYLCLVDVAVTNAKICYSLRNIHIEVKKKESHAEFLENIADILLNANSNLLHKFGRNEELRICLEVDSEDEMLNDLNLLFSSPLNKKEDERIAKKSIISTASLPECKMEEINRTSELTGKRKSHGALSCQICKLELRPNTRTKVVQCSVHKIRACTIPRLTDNNERLPFIGQPEDFHKLSCWDKAHSFYLVGKNNIIVEPKKDRKKHNFGLVKNHPIMIARSEYLQSKQGD